MKTRIDGDYGDLAGKDIIFGIPKQKGKVIITSHPKVPIAEQFLEVEKEFGKIIRISPIDIIRVSEKGEKNESMRVAQ